MNTDKLIRLVRNHECIFNVKHKEHNNLNLKNMIWNDIGDTMGLPGENCKKRWFSVRDQFRRVLKNRSSLNPEDGALKEWKYERSLSFMIPFFQGKRDTPTLSAINVAEEVNFVDVPVYDDDNTMFKYEATSVEDDQHSEPYSQSSRDAFTSTGTSSSEPQLKKLKLSESGESLATPTDLIDYIVEQKDKSSVSKHPIDLFAASIAATIKTFPPIHQHMIKSKIFNLVSDLEIQLIAESKAEELSPLQNNGHLCS